MQNPHERARAASMLGPTPQLKRTGLTGPQQHTHYREDGEPHQEYANDAAESPTGPEKTRHHELVKPLRDVPEGTGGRCSGVRKINVSSCGGYQPSEEGLVERAEESDRIRLVTWYKCKKHTVLKPVSLGGGCWAYSVR